MSHLPQPPPGGPPGAEQPFFDPAAELDRIRATQLGLRRRFMLVNGGAFALTTVLAVTGGTLLSTSVPGGQTLGTLLCLVQVVLLMVTAWLYDSSSRGRTDARVERVRAHALLPAHALRPEPEQGR